MVYIGNKLIEVAKERVYDPEKSLSEMVNELGFKYPRQLSSLLKGHAGHS